MTKQLDDLWFVCDVCGSEYGHNLELLNVNADGNNVAIGYTAGQDVSTGLKNTIIGSLAGNIGSNDLYLILITLNQI